jgi:hypothetical protein
MHKVFIIDDDVDRALNFVAEATRRRLKTQFLNPAASEDGAISEGDNTEDVRSAARLAAFLGKQEPPAIWLWDIHLKFNLLPEYVLSSYAEGDVLFDAMLRLMKARHAFVFTSMDFQLETLKQRFVDAGADPSRIGYVVNLETKAKTYEGEFAERVIKAAQLAAEGSILSSLAGISRGHFPAGIADQNCLPHNLPDPRCCPAEWTLAVKMLHDELAKLTGASDLVLARLLKGNESGIYETAKTLMGEHAKAHVGSGRVPCIGILPLLLLRGLVGSGRWDDESILRLFDGIKWSDRVRDVKLCAEQQDSTFIRSWLVELADKLFPALSVTRTGGGRSGLEAIELTGPLFRLVFASEWRPMIEAVHRNRESSGSTYSPWHKASHQLGACGPEIGRITRCTIDVYAENGKTYFDFRAIP